MSTPNIKPPIPVMLARSRKKFLNHEVVAEASLPEFYQRTAKMMKKLNLPASKEKLRFLGSRPLDPKSADKYIGCLRTLVRFLMLHPEFDDSLVMFRYDCPPGSLVCEEKAVSICILSQFTEKDQPVLDMKTREPLLDAKGKPFLGTGLWNDPCCCDGFASAVTHFHENAHKSGTQYVEKCEGCLQLYNKNLSIGCNLHKSNPSPSRTGNVMKSRLVVDTMKFIKMNSNHIVEGANRLTPSDVRDIGEYCISSNDHYNYCLFVLTLVSIDLFLRKMEFSSLHNANFSAQLSVVNRKDAPDSLCFKVKRKKKKESGKGPNVEGDRIRHMHVWGEDKCMDICAKRHLLAFLYSINWKGGYLFPTQKEINNPPHDGVYVTHVDEENLYAGLKHIFCKVLGRTEKLGTHSFRKSGYLFAKLRGAGTLAAMRAADHKCYEVVDRYYKGIDSFITTNSISQDPKQRVGIFRNPYSDGDETAVRQLAPCRKFQKDLPSLVTSFMESVVGIDPGDPQALTPKSLARRVIEWDPPSDPATELRQHLKDISSDKSRVIMDCMQAMKTEALNSAMLQHRADLYQFQQKMHQEKELFKEKLKEDFYRHIKANVTRLEANVVAALKLPFFFEGPQIATSPIRKRGQTDIPSSNTVTPSPPSKRKRAIEKRSGYLELPAEYFRSFKSMTAQEQIDVLKYIAHLQSPPGDYVDSHRKFIYRYKKAAHCLATCCAGDGPTFTKKHFGTLESFSLNKIIENKMKACPNCHSEAPKRPVKKVKNSATQI